MALYDRWYITFWNINLYPGFACEVSPGHSYSLGGIITSSHANVIEPLSPLSKSLGHSYPAHDPEVLVPFSGGATGALQVGHVCCRSNHERRHCTWNRCPQLSLFAVVISSRQMMQVASLLNDYHLSVTYHKSNGIQIIRTRTSKGWTTHVFSSSGVASGKRSSILEVIFR